MLPTFEISIRGFPEPMTRSAATRSKARYLAWLDFSDAFECSFREFQSMSSVKKRPVPEIDGYDYIRRAYGVDVKVGQRVQLKGEGSWSGREGEVIYPGGSTAYVQVLLDGQEHPSPVHPASIEILPTGGN